jgi:hypothetical protein
MSKEQFEIKKYQVTLGSDLLSIVTNIDMKVVGIIGCYGKDVQIMINFVAEGEELPISAYDSEKSVGTMFRPISLMPIYIDLLRNEKPVFGYLNSEKPEWNSISTGHEPVGEGE